MPERSLEPPAEMHLRPDESTRFRLGGAGSAGYGWTWELEGDAGSISVAMDAAPSRTPAPYGSVDHFITVHALKAGTVRLRLTLARPFQPNRPPRASFDVHITVTGR